MASRGQIVNYTYAANIDVVENGQTVSRIGYFTRPAIVLVDHGGNVCDLFVFGETWEFPNNTNVIFRVSQGPKPPDSPSGKNVDPTAVPGQAGTWSA